MLRGMQANVVQRRALSQLYQAKGVAHGTVDAVSDITLWPKPSCIPAKGVGPKAQTWAWPAQIRARSCAGNPTLWDFRKNAEHSMCELTTGWILEKCPKPSVCTYHNVDFRKNTKHLMWELTTEWIFRNIYLVLRSMVREWRTTHSSEWEGTQTLRRERQAHRWPSMVRGAMLARPTRRATYHRTLESGELKRSERSGMLIGDPLGEGSNASATNNELWLQREWHAHRWPSRWGEQC